MAIGLSRHCERPRRSRWHRRAGWAGSLTLGADQFCTNPGIVVGVKGEKFDDLQRVAVAVLNDTAEQKMLTDGIQEAYSGGVAHLKEHIGELITCGTTKKPRHGLPAAFKTSASHWMFEKSLQHNWKAN